MWKIYAPSLLRLVGFLLLPEAAAGLGSVVGHVREKDGAAPVAGATVRVAGKDLAALSDAAGRFTFWCVATTLDGERLASPEGEARSAGIATVLRRLPVR